MPEDSLVKYVNEKMRTGTRAKIIFQVLISGTF